MIPKEEVGEAIEVLGDLLISVKNENIGRSPENKHIREVNREKAIPLAITILQLYHEGKLVIPMDVGKIEKIIKDKSCEAEYFDDGGLVHPYKLYHDIALALHNSIGSPAVGRQPTDEGADLGSNPKLPTNSIGTQMTREGLIETIGEFEWDILHYDIDQKIRDKYNGEIDDLWGAIADAILNTPEVEK